MTSEWDTTVPANSLAVSAIPANFKSNKTNIIAILEKEHATLGDENSGCQHKTGSASCYVGTSAPTQAPDESTSLSTGNADKGRLWLNDNFDPPLLERWDGSAVEEVATIGGRLHADGDGEAVAYIQNLYKEDTDGGRGCRLIAKGTQSGAEVTTLGYLEFAHDGSSNDQKGKCTIVVNDGDDSNTPSKKAIQFSSDGKIVVANSVSVLDEDAMGTDSAVQLATQKSIKAQIAIQVAAALASYVTLSAYTNEDSEPTAMLKTHAYKAATDGWVSAVVTNLTSSQYIKLYVDTDSDPVSGGNLVSVEEAGTTNPATDHCVSALVAKNEYFEVLCSGTPTILWKSFGALSKPVDQEA